MPFSLTREQLYDLIWSEPLQRLSQQIGISDVGIAKHCRNIGVPIPERGYWNKVHAGKKVTKAELSPRDLGTINRIEMKGTLEPGLLTRIKGEPGVDSAPESIEVLTERFRKRLGTVTAPRNLTRTHPVIEKLLKRDELIRQKRATERYYWRDPQFESAFERRRLRILNGLFLGFEKVGGGGWIRDAEARELHSHVGHAGVSFELDHTGRKVNGRRPAPAEGNTKLVLSVSINGTPLPVTTQWEDKEGNPLENQMTEIVVGMAVAGEHLHRRWIEQVEAWERERREREERDAREKREAAERRERERLAAIRQARIDGLVGDATGWKNARLIREYVAAVRNMDVENREELEAWAQWALAEADRQDPIVSGRIAASFRRESAVSADDDAEKAVD